VRRRWPRKPRHRVRLQLPDRRQEVRRGITFLNSYTSAHPTSQELWRVYAGLGDAYSAKGDPAKAKEYYDKAMAAAHDTAERTEVWDSINAAASEAK